MVRFLGIKNDLYYVPASFECVPVIETPSWWCVLLAANSVSCMYLFRLVDIAPHYYDLTNFPQCEAKHVLDRLYKKRERDREQNKKKK